MDQLRARAYLDILLGKDSRPAAAPAAGHDSEDREDSEDSEPASSTGGDVDDPGDRGFQAPHPAGPHVPPTAGVLPAGFAGHVNLTTPLAALLGLAERPGELSGLGPVDPALARDLAGAAAANPGTTWCLTVTDEHGHAIGHGCARPAPRNRQPGARTGGPAPPGGPDPPGGPGRDPAPRFTFTATGAHGPPGGYGSWRLSTGIGGQPDLIITVDPIAQETCDHRFEARGHDPGGQAAAPAPDPARHVCRPVLPETSPAL
jgi:hypothetical protein